MSNTIVLFSSQETCLEELAQIKHLALTLYNCRQPCPQSTAKVLYRPGASGSNLLPVPDYRRRITSWGLYTPWPFRLPPDAPSVATAAGWTSCR